MIVYKRSVCPHDCPDTCGPLAGVGEKGEGALHPIMFREMEACRAKAFL